jgi:hypothetical protein
MRSTYKLPDGRVATTQSQRRYVLFDVRTPKVVIIRRSDTLGRLVRDEFRGRFILDTATDTVASSRVEGVTVGSYTSARGEAASSSGNFDRRVY